MVRGQTDQYPKIWGIFEVQATFLTVGTHESHQIFRKDVFGCLTPSRQFLSQNIDRKIYL